MTSAAADFERELEIFRREADAAAQFFYSFLTVHAVAGDRKVVHSLLNRHALFWNTTLSALQMGTFITLGRIFDQNSPHNVDRLLGLAQRNVGIFSKGSLGQRKQGTSATAPSWLPQYLQKAYEPKRSDFRRLRKHVHARRRLYEEKYRDLRHKVFAHREITEPEEVAALFSKTNIRELERILAFLGSLHDALWQLFFNGRRPGLSPRRYSVRRIRDLPSPAWKQRAVSERITHDVETFLTSIARAVEFENAARSKRGQNWRGRPHGHARRDREAAA